MKVIHVISFILLVVGGLNWLLTAFNYNVVALLGTSVANVIYVLVGLAAIVEIFTHKSNCKACPSTPAAPTMM